MTDPLARLAELRKHLADAETAMADLHAAAPAGAEATDGTGMIRVVLGPDGLPTSIEVQPDWRRSLGSERFGAAVTEAATAAREARMTRWAASVRDADTSAAASPKDRPPVGLDELVLDGVEVRTDRPLIDAVSEMFDAATEVIDKVGGDAAASPPEGAGSFGYGKLTITLDGLGAVACTADPHWVAEQDADGLTEALGRALASARAELAGRPGSPIDTQRLGALAAEVYTALRNSGLSG